MFDDIIERISGSPQAWFWGSGEVGGATARLCLRPSKNPCDCGARMEKISAARLYMFDLDGVFDPTQIMRPEDHRDLKIALETEWPRLQSQRCIQATRIGVEGYREIGAASRAFAVLKPLILRAFRPLLSADPFLPVGSPELMLAQFA